MKRSRRSQRLKISLITSIFLILSVPIVLYGLITTEDTDPRSDAGVEELTTYCTISFPYVMSNSVEIGKTVQITINGSAPSEVDLITSVKIETSEGDVLLDKVYSQPESSITETVTLTTYTVGDIRIFGQMETTSLNYPCILEGSDGSQNVKTQTINHAPEFSSDPDQDAEPSNAIKVGDSYSYELRAKDQDGDDIQFSYSFTPRADWLTMSIISGGTGGDLKLVFQGISDTPASYLANVFIHDGYNQHLRAQTWIISVDPAQNDTPIVTVTAPPPGVSINQGQSITTSWSATDLNQIVNYKLYYATNPGNVNTWKPVDENISYQIGSYIVNSSSIEPGSYKFVVEAVDNQSPPATGRGVSELFTVVGVTPPPDEGGEEEPPPEEEEPDDGVVIQEAQIVNLNPSDGSTINNAKRTISATLVASKDATIVIDSIEVMLDSQSITDSLEISEISESEVTVIYKPTNDLEVGEHKVEVSFEDSEGGTATREWTFTLELLDEDDDDMINLFGFDISTRTAWIIMIGLGIILLALIIPWILYLAWRDNDDDEMTVYDIKPSGLYPYNQPYTPPIQKVDVTEPKMTKVIEDDYVPKITMPAKVEEKKFDTPQPIKSEVDTYKPTKPTRSEFDISGPSNPLGSEVARTDDDSITNVEEPKTSRLSGLKSFLPLGKKDSKAFEAEATVEQKDLGLNDEPTDNMKNIVSPPDEPLQSTHTKKFKPSLRLKNDKSSDSKTFVMGGDPAEDTATNQDTSPTQEKNEESGQVPQLTNADGTPKMWKPRVIVPPRKEKPVNQDEPDRVTEEFSDKVTEQVNDSTSEEIIEQVNDQTTDQAPDKKSEYLNESVELPETGPIKDLEVSKPVDTEQVDTPPTEEETQNSIDQASSDSLTALLQQIEESKLMADTAPKAEDPTDVVSSDDEPTTPTDHSDQNNDRNRDEDSAKVPPLTFTAPPPSES